MTTLREATKKRIFDSLEQTHFTAGCFSVTFAEDKNPFVNIAFIPDKKFSFTIGEPTRFNSSGYISEEAPGRHIESGEEYKHDDLDSCIKAITPWVGRIIEDYRLKNPVMDEFETFRKTLADQFEQHVQDKFAHFTFDEADALRRKLDDLATRLQEVDEKNEQYERRLKETMQEIDRIKADIEVFPKGVWFNMAGSKIVGLVKKIASSKEGREFAMEAARKFLLEGPK